MAVTRTRGGGGGGGGEALFAIKNAKSLQTTEATRGQDAEKVRNFLSRGNFVADIEADIEEVSYCTVYI